MHARFAVFILFILGLPAILSSQRSGNPNEALAIQFLESKEYEKALPYLEDLYGSQQESWFLPYYRCLMALKEYGKAEKICKKEIKRNPRNPVYQVHLGRVNHFTGNEKNEKEAYERALKEVNPIQPEVQSLASVFMEYGLYDYALAVYNKGSSADTPYYFEKAEVYKSKGDLSGMTGEYLDAIEFRETDLETVKRNLQNSLGYDDEEGGFRNPVLK